MSTGKAWWDDVSLRKVEYETITGEESEVTEGDVERGKRSSIRTQLLTVHAVIW